MEKFKIAGFIEYQAKDVELYNLEKKLYNSKEFLEMKKLETEVGTLKAQRSACMSEAKDVLAELKDRAAKITDLIGEHIQDNFDKFDDVEDIACEEDILKDVLSKLDKAEKDYKAKNSAAVQLAKKINSIQKMISDDRTKAAKVKTALDAVKAEIMSQWEPLNEQLVAMRTTLDQPTLQRYLNVRKAKGQPVLVELANGNCSRCGMDIHIEMQALKAGEAAECPNCGRLVYIAEGSAK